MHYLDINVFFGSKFWKKYGELIGMRLNQKMKLYALQNPLNTKTHVICVEQKTQ